MQAIKTGGKIEDIMNQITNTERDLYSRKSSVQSPGKNAEDSDDSISAEVHLMEMVIRNIKNEFCYTKEQLCYGSIDDLKKALKSYISALEELYKIFEKQ